MTEIVFLNASQLHAHEVSRPQFPIERLPGGLLARVLELAGSRAAWRLRRVSRAWKEAAQGVDWSPFELEVRGEEEAARVTALARDGRLRVRGDLHLRAAFAEKLPVDRPQEQPAGLLAALAGLLAALAGAPGCAWRLREADLRVKLAGNRGRSNLCLLRVLEALRPAAAASTSPLRSLAIDVDLNRTGDEVSAEEEGDLGGLRLSDILRAALPLFPDLERLALPGRASLLDPGCLGAIADCLGPRLRELRLGGPEACVNDLLRFPLLERCGDTVRLEERGDAERLLSGLPRLRSVGVEVTGAESSRGLAESLPLAPALRELALSANRVQGEERKRELASLIKGAQGVLREVRLKLGAPDATPALWSVLRAVAGCQRLQRAEITLELEEPEWDPDNWYFNLCDPPEFTRYWLAARNVAWRLLEETLEPCKRAGVELKLAVHSP
eukprot:tig00000478_g1272.t1